MRKPRYFPFRTLVEVTCQTFQGRYLLTPTREACDLIVGVIGRAQRRYGVDIHAFTFLSNHYHFLLTVRDGLQLALFMGYVNSNIARELGRLIGWSDKFWSRRYQAIPVSDEAEAQLARLRYVLSQGVKEGLVSSVTDWPGVHAASALLSTERISGTWYDRSRQYALHRGKKTVEICSFAETETVVLTPLGCWTHLEPAVRKARVRDLIEDIERQGAVERNSRRLPPRGAETIREQDPKTRPPGQKRSAAPVVHAASRRVRERFLENYREFIARFRTASERLRSGDRRAVFPEGCFAPALGWIPTPTG